MLLPSVTSTSAAKSASSAASLAANSLGTVAAGATVIVFLEMEAAGAGAFTASFSDGPGNTYTQIGSYQNANANKRLCVFAAYNVVGGGTFTVTATPSSSCNMTIGALNIANARYTVSFLDNAQGTTGTSTSPAAGSTTITGSSEMIFTVFSSVAAGTITATTPTGYTVGPQNLAGTTNPILSTAYKINPTAGSENPTWTIVSAAWAAISFSIFGISLPTVNFNSSTGSDTAASGSGGTAVNGTLAATNTNKTINITDAVDLSAIPLDGTAVLWVGSSSGKQFSEITNITGSSGAWVVTSKLAYANTESGKTWGIGGKRATWDNANSRTSFVDGQPGWIIQSETDPAVSGSAITVSCIGNTTTGYITIRGTSNNPRPIITQSANAAIFSVGSGAFLKFENLDHRNSNGTKSSAIGLSVSFNSTTVTVSDCIFGHGTNKLLNGISVNNIGLMDVIDCEIKSCTGAGISTTAFSNLRLVGNNIHDNTGAGVTGAPPVRAHFNKIWNNGGDGLNLGGGASTGFDIIGNVIHNNTGDGIDISANQVMDRALIINNNITKNGGYGINARGEQDIRKTLIDYNNFGTGATANTLGSMLNITAGTYDLAVDPGYTDATTGDFTPGTRAKAKAFPTAGGTNLLGAGNALASYGDLGSTQAQATGGTSGGSYTYSY